MALSLAHIEGVATHRLIASRYPTVGPFDYMGDVETIEAALALEGATNDRLNDVAGRLALLAPGDIAIGVPSAHQAMAPFLHPAEAGGRFNGPELGAWYAALDIETAIAETRYHHHRRLAASQAGFPSTIEMRELLSRPSADLVDLRRLDDAALYHHEDYRAGQRFGRARRDERRDGIWYRSVRRREGENVVLFKPRLLVPVIQGDHYRYDWDAQGAFSATRLTPLGEVL
ncbi:MAG: RES family NAD+ phosphorylase [Alphaproteobacteria bacterium]